MPMNPTEQHARFDKQGYSQHLGIEFDHVEEGYARLRMPVKEYHLQSAMTAHGGIVATIADACSAQALFTLLKDDEVFSSIELKVNYLSPGLPGHTLIGEGRIIRRGGRIALGDMEVKDEESGRLVAKGLHTFLIQKDPGQSAPK